MTVREWAPSIYAKGQQSLELRLAGAHRAAALRNPLKSAQHLMSAALLQNTTSAQKPKDSK
jgi:hypothetical protein